MAAYFNTVLRPKRSLSGPAKSIARAALSVRQEVDHPSSKSDILNSGPTKTFTPEITEASKPIRSPPNATIRAIVMMTYLLDFIGFGDIGYDSIF
tara:strand:- start:1961 stop:2245 length:285 start_codon:yes stop_codon:yes gene_type:complete